MNVDDTRALESMIRKSLFGGQAEEPERSREIVARPKPPSEGFRTPLSGPEEVDADLAKFKTFSRYHYNVPDAYTSFTCALLPPLEYAHDEVNDFSFPV